MSLVTEYFFVSEASVRFSLTSCLLLFHQSLKTFSKSLEIKAVCAMFFVSSFYLFVISFS